MHLTYLAAGPPIVKSRSRTIFSCRFNYRLLKPRFLFSHFSFGGTKEKWRPYPFAHQREKSSKKARSAALRHFEELVHRQMV